MGQELEELFAPNLRGPMSTRTSEERNPWAGFATINSGSAFATVSTAMVKSGNLIFTQSYPGSVAVSIQSAGHVVVNSIVNNVSFALGWSTGVAASWDTVVGWEMRLTKR